MKTTNTQGERTESTIVEMAYTAKREYWNNKRRHSHITRYKLVFA